MAFNIFRNTKNSFKTNVNHNASSHLHASTIALTLRWLIIPPGTLPGASFSFIRNFNCIRLLHQRNFDETVSSSTISLEVYQGFYLKSDLIRHKWDR
jgi:hypothetical protein